MRKQSALIIGGGGREHALGEAIAPSVKEIYFAPGNAGTAMIENATNIDVEDPAAFAKEHKIGLTLIGPEKPLAAGLADRLRAEKLPVFGPSQEGAQLETSKAFASIFMSKYSITQPSTRVLTSSTEISSLQLPLDDPAIVVKADGLGDGKAVVLPQTRQEAEATIEGMLSGQLYGGAGAEGVVLQNRVKGPEISAFIATDGKRFVTLPFAQDHKRLKDNDEGPNTGGMGSYTPVPETVLNQGQIEKIHEISERTIEGMKAEGIDYRGVIYIGLMLDEEKDGEPTVIEYNVRFGDPEAQVILPVLTQAGVDVFELLRSTDSKLDERLLPAGALLGQSALTVCLAAKGYPEKPRPGDIIIGCNGEYDNVSLHHGSTTIEEGSVMVTGGRAMYVTGMGESVDEAALSAYRAIGNGGVSFSGMQYRKDIGKQARTGKSLSER
jgi:phosphoribosylamine--glycine ligase